MTSVLINSELFESAIKRVRAQSNPVHTTPVGWSDKTVELLNILKKNNPYTTLSNEVQTELKKVKKMPDLCDYLPWFRVGPGHKEACANQLELERNPPPPKIKDYAEY